ncbi:hypothetical protein [uncultured Psychroserpens sp.]|uniref:hypothetical protein n=1 Tax=uncultured Psychroserpens sp. TaxID=255436 RepID=UPI00260AD640|nr:hypothetical protein [uncultured Psychroserpens sp.]
MTLSEVYFYMIIIIYQFLSLVILVFTEDLKDEKRYKKYFKISFLIGLLGIIMEVLNWNYFCRFNCVLMTFTPFLTLNIAKGTMILFEKIFKKVPYQTHRGKLSDGIWIENKGDIKYRNYYNKYTFSIMILPIFIITGLFILIKENVC